MTQMYTIYKLADITEPVRTELAEQHDLNFIKPRRCTSGIWAIATGKFYHPDVTHYYVTQKEAEKLMLTAEWSQTEEHTDDL